MTNIYQQLTDKVISQMETLGTDWIKPWSGKTSYNAVSGKEYRGINRLLLSEQVYATYKQWNELGYQVKSGEKSSMVVFASKVAGKKASDTDSNDDSENEGFSGWVNKVYNVFSSNQLTTEYAISDTIKQNLNHAPIAEIDALITDNNIKVLASHKAAFNPAEDLLKMPAPEAFTSSETYYSTLLHELTHWTGHKTRLNREQHGAHKKHAYAYEELIAELGSVFLTNHYGIEAAPRDDHAIYLNNWMQALKNDNRLIFKAAAAAQTATEYLTTSKGA